MSRQIVIPSETDWAVYEMQAEFCKALSHPTRHASVQQLKDGERNVTELAQTLHVSQANLSQHLAVLRDAGVVVAKRKGVNVSYSIADEAIIRACSIIHKAIQDRILKQRELISSRDFSHTPTQK